MLKIGVWAEGTDVNNTTEIKHTNFKHSVSGIHGSQVKRGKIRIFPMAIGTPKMNYPIPLKHLGDGRNAHLNGIPTGSQVQECSLNEQKIQAIPYSPTTNPSYHIYMPNNRFCGSTSYVELL